MKEKLRNIFGIRAKLICQNKKDVPRFYKIERIERGSTAVIARHRFLG